MAAGRSSPALAGRRSGERRAPSTDSRAQPPRPPSTPAASAPSPAVEPHALRPGAEVEVRVDAPGFHGSWFEATVVPARAGRRRLSEEAPAYAVAFAHLSAEDAAAAALGEPVAASRIRPRPPRPGAGPSARRFALHDVVEAFHRGGWWSGVVVAGPAAPSTSVTVAFPVTREVVTVPPHYVRPRRDYVDGEWVPSQYVVAVKPDRAVKVYSVGDKVEVAREREVYGHSWFPATVATTIDSQSYIVEYTDHEEGKPTEYLHWQYIRPAEEHSPSEGEFQLVPGTAVEAYCEGAWSPAVVRRVVGEGEYEVSVNSKGTEHLVTKVAELLKPQYEWDGNQWSFADLQTQANARQRPASGKRPSSPIDVVSSDDEHSQGPEYSATKKLKIEYQQTEGVLPEGFEHASVSEMGTPLYPLRKTPESNHFPNSHPLLPGHSTPPNESMPDVGKAAVNQQISSNIVFSVNKEKTQPMQALHGKHDASDNVNSVSSKEISCALNASLEFQTTTTLTRQLPETINRGPNKKVVTYRKKLPNEIGVKGPCSQHNSLDLATVQQEGMASDLVVSIVSLVESMGASCIEDSDASFEDTNSKLSELKANVEYLQSCQNKLTEAKSEYMKFLEEKDAVEAQKQEKITTLSQLDSLLNENDKAIGELEQKLGHLRQKGRNIEKKVEHEKLELSRLEEVECSIEQACRNAKQLFTSILAELQPK
ncbi:hypothetical protein ACP70R_007567 [Stipagrostis hirtigluma subsp. patula]